MQYIYQQIRLAREQMKAQENGEILENIDGEQKEEKTGEDERIKYE